MRHHYLTATIGVLLLVVGLALAAFVPYYLADRMLFSMRTGLTLQFEEQEPTWLAACSLLGLMLSCTGAFVLWLGIRGFGHVTK